MDVIYSKTNEKPIFRTSHHYKSRSEYWQYGKPLNDKIEDTEKIGIYIGEKKIGSRGRCICTSKEEPFLRRDTALLVICSGSFYRKACGIECNENMNILKGDIILMAGFGKYGTYQLSRIISKVNRPSSDKDEPIGIKETELTNLSISVEELFLEINNTRKDRDDYCVELIFYFIKVCHRPDEKNDVCKNCDCKKDDTTPYKLKIMNSISLDGEGRINKENLLQKILNRKKRQLGY